MTKLSLDKLIAPVSIAVVGVSQRPNTVGNEVIVNLQKGGYSGDLFFVNPRYQNLMGQPCFESLSLLPKKPEHVIFTINDTRLEESFDELIRLGIKACTIFSSLILQTDSEPNLKSRINTKAKEHGILIIGANSMGVYNIANNTLIGGFDTRDHPFDGNTTLISQSGAGMSGIVDCEERIKFNLAVSTGYELTTTMEDYLEYAIDLPDTKVIGLFLETVRNPEKFIMCLERAAEEKIPIVVIKVGKTELSKKMAESHSGAMAGSDRAYNALFRRFGVLRVDDMEQMSACLIMMSHTNSVGTGDLVCLHDSGGERQLLIDLADSLDVPLAKISEDTKLDLNQILDPGLPAVNPLDGWGAGGANASEVMASSFEKLLLDESAALGAVVHDRGPNSEVYTSYIDYLKRGEKVSKKPVFLVSNRQGSGEDRLAVELSHEGFPVIDGIHQFLVGVKKMLEFRDFHSLKKQEKSFIDLTQYEFLREKIEKGLTSDQMLFEFLNCFDIPMNKLEIVSSLDELLNMKYNFPVVLKTANPDVKHKSDEGGVFLNIDSKQALANSYEELSVKFGSFVSVSPFIEHSGIEMILGITKDEQFGPLILMGFGGIYTEVFNQVILLMPPFDCQVVRNALRELPHYNILHGVRGESAVDIESYCKAAVGLSDLALAFGDCIDEMDINPVKVMAKGCIGLDALLICSQKQISERECS